jgi:hypothetical protein
LILLAYWKGKISTYNFTAESAEIAERLRVLCVLCGKN